ncbi:MAG TPA: arylsulfatase, partial [Pirellulaceae bacterium]
LLLIAFATSHANAADPTRPNIVYILADDLGYGDLGCYNRDSKIPTPNLDRLANEGIRFTDAHSPSSVCTPTRYGVLTGRYCWRSRLKAQVLGPWGTTLIEEGRLTAPQLLRNHGYATHCVGKWHLGFDWPTKDGQPAESRQNVLSNVDFTKPIPNGPITRGFSSYFGVDLPNFPPYIYIENDHTLGIPSVPNSPAQNRPGPMLPGWNWVNVLPDCASRAVKVIEDAAIKRGAAFQPATNPTVRRSSSDPAPSAPNPESRTPPPFFLYFPLTSPHYPVVPDPEFRGKSLAGDFGDFVVQTDAVVGQILDALQRTGLAENTLVIFTSDNGPEVIEIKPGAYDRLKEYGHASMGQLRGCKRDLWEGGHRVPFIARWPGQIPTGATSTETICHVDFLATLAALLGTKLPDDAGEDSYNILPALRNEKPKLGEGLPAPPIRPATVHHAASGKSAIRQGDWVFLDAPTGDDNGPPNRRLEPQWFKDQRGYQPHNHPGELYNLSTDLSQRHNLYADHPDKVRDLKALLTQYQQQGRSR